MTWDDVVLTGYDTCALADDDIMLHTHGPPAGTRLIATRTHPQ